MIRKRRRIRRKPKVSYGTYEEVASMPRRLAETAIILKTDRDIEKMRRSGQIASQVLEAIAEVIAPRMTTQDLDDIARQQIEKNGGIPSFLGYQVPGHPPYPASICSSVNEMVIHGVPGLQILKPGDIVGVDVGAYVDGYHGDNAFTFTVGEIPENAQKLLQVTREALYRGIAQARPGNYLGDVSSAIQSHAESNGFSVVRALVGHGIGKDMHEPPQVPNFGRPGQEPQLKPGMVLAIEPMINEGTWEVALLEDGWSVVTADHLLSAHFEHTVAVLSDGPEILTRNDNLWGI